MGEWHHPDHFTEEAKLFAIEETKRCTDLIIERVLPTIQSRCKEIGYAVAVHGSKGRDLDLVAIPWTDEAKSTEDLIALVCQCVRDQTGWGNLINNKPEPKPHGRVAVTINASFLVEIDLSIMPRLYGFE